MGHGGEASGTPLERLTGKQRQVLDLLVEHKTSKEIARELGISPHTVDQRINFAKEKLQVQSRGEAAVAYRRLLETYERTTYEDSGIATPAAAGDGAGGAQGTFPISGSTTPNPRDGERERSTSVPEAEVDYPVVPDLFEGRYGTLARLAAIVAIAVLLILLVLGGLAILSQVSLLMSG